MKTSEFLKTITEEEGKNLLKARCSNEDVYKIFAKKGLTDSYEEFSAELQKGINERLFAMSREEIVSKLEGTELSEEELEQIAGGKGKDPEEKKTMTTGDAVGWGLAAGMGFAFACACGL